jgi:predicted RNase H-like nuclease
VRVAGVDGCRGGWVIAVANGERVDISVRPDFRQVVDLLDHGVDAIAVDIPVGLPAAGARACDLAARRLLGPRRASVFPAPPRALLHERDFPTALRAKRAIDGTGLSKQAFLLLPKIAAVDAAITPDLQHRIVEAHPELAFRRRACADLLSKHTSAGLDQRRRLVAGLHPHRPLSRPAGARPDDVLDAVVLTATARRLALGQADHLGDGRCDARGLVMEIVW